MKLKKVLLVFLVSVFVLAAGQNICAQNKLIQVGEKFPGFFLKDIEGGNFFLNDYVGDNANKDCKALIISFSASYCKPCKKEIPELATFIEKYEDKGLKIVIVALEKEEQARKLIAETKTALPVLLDKFLLVPKMIGNKGIPFTVLLDSDGTVQMINTGFSENNAQEFVDRMEKEVVKVLGIDS